MLSTYAFTNYNSIANADHYVYRWIGPDVDVNFWFSFICPPTMAVLVLLFPFLGRQWVRVIWAVLFYLTEGFLFTYILGHASHALVWICIFLALLPGRPDSYDDNHSTLQAFVRLSQLQIFTIYGLAGVWKIIGFTESIFDDNVTSGLNYLQYAMSSEFLYSNRLYPSAEWVSEHTWLCAILSALVVVAQAGSLLVAFVPRLYLFWGLLLAIFHIGTLFTVNVFFYWSIPPIVLILCLCPMPNLGFKSILNSIRGSEKNSPVHNR